MRARTKAQLNGSSYFVFNLGNALAWSSGKWNSVSGNAICLPSLFLRAGSINISAKPICSSWPIQRPVTSYGASIILLILTYLFLEA